MGLFLKSKFVGKSRTKVPTYNFLWLARDELLGGEDQVGEQEVEEDGCTAFFTLSYPTGHLHLAST